MATSGRTGRKIEARAHNFIGEFVVGKMLVKEMLRMCRRESSALILVGFFSFLLIFIGTKASHLFFLAWIGGWLVLAALVWHFLWLREEMRKKGYDLLW